MGWMAVEAADSVGADDSVRAAREPPVQGNALARIIMPVQAALL